MIFTQAPDNFAFDIEVAACYLIHKDKVLMLHRAKHDGDCWALVAGTVEEGEEVRAGLVREMFEETGVVSAPEKLEYVDTLHVRFPESDIVYHSYVLCVNDSECPRITLDPSEHQDFQWATFDEVYNLELIYGLKECFERHRGILHQYQLS